MTDARAPSGDLDPASAHEPYYRLVFERNPIPMWIYDDETLRFLAVNDSAVAHYGWTREEFLGMTILDIRPNTEIPLVHHLRDTPRDAIHQVSRPLHHLRRDGSVRDVEIVSHGLTWQGRPARFVAATDITDRVAAERALRESEARLAGIVGSAMDAIVSVDETQRIVLFNAAAERTFGVAASEAVGSPLSRFVPARFHAAHEEAVRLFGQFDTTTRHMGTLSQLTARRADGSEFPIEAAISKVQVGERWIFTVVLRDITSRLSLEDQLRQAQRLEAVGLLAGGIAHDFNNLLSAINGYLELLDPAVTSAQGRADLGEVQAAAERAAQLTRQLLTFSRRHVLRPRLVDPNDVIHGVQKLLRRLIGEDVALRTDFDTGARMIHVDPGQLEQVVMNLAVNARDAMPHGGTLTIRTRHLTKDAIRAPLTAESPHDWTVLEVGDTGSGMSSEIVRRAYDPFFTTKAEGRGTGLGLATVRAIADQAQGVTWIESVEGDGTSVFVAFPTAPLSAESEHDAGEVAAASTAVAPSLRVLLVEDDEAVRAISTRLLRWRGHLVTTAGSGVEGLQRCREALQRGEPFDVLVTDVIMPEMGGRELVRQARLEQPSIAVVYCSGYVGDSAAGFEQDSSAELLAKPFTSDELDRAIARALEKAGPR